MKPFDRGDMPWVVLQNAGINHDRPIPARGTRIREGPSTQLEYEELLDALAYLRMLKVQGYGETRYDPEGARYNLALGYGDLERKLIRIKNFVFGSRPLTSKVVLQDVAESAADLANYAVMMLQVCALLAERGLCEDEQPDT